MKEVQYATMCRCCRRLQGGRQCEAYPEIPLAIWEGRQDHFDAQPGDRGLRYLLDTDSEVLAEAWVETGLFPARLLTQR